MDECEETLTWFKAHHRYVTTALTEAGAVLSMLYKGKTPEEMRGMSPDEWENEKKGFFANAFKHIGEPGVPPKHMALLAALPDGMADAESTVKEILDNMKNWETTAMHPDACELDKGQLCVVRRDMLAGLGVGFPKVPDNDDDVIVVVVAQHGWDCLVVCKDRRDADGSLLTGEAAFSVHLHDLHALSDGDLHRWRGEIEAAGCADEADMRLFTKACVDGALSSGDGRFTLYTSDAWTSPLFKMLRARMGELVESGEAEWCEHEGERHDDGKMDAAGIRRPRRDEGGK